MLLALLLTGVWFGMTKTFVFYIRQRMKCIHEIEAELGMRLMSEAGAEIQARGWRAKFTEAQFYVHCFLILYAALWLGMLVFRFDLF